MFFWPPTTLFCQVYGCAKSTLLHGSQVLQLLLNGCTHKFLGTFRWMYWKDHVAVFWVASLNVKGISKKEFPSILHIWQACWIMTPGHQLFVGVYSSIAGTTRVSLSPSTLQDSLSFLNFAPQYSCTHQHMF